MKTIAVAVCAALALSGCAALGFSEKTPEVAREKTVLFCTSYPQVVRSLALYRAAGKLSKLQIARVDQSLPLLNQVCAADAQPIGEQTYAQVEQAVFDLSNIQIEAQTK